MGDDIADGGGLMEEMYFLEGLMSFKEDHIALEKERFIVEVWQMNERVAIRSPSSKIPFVVVLEKTPMLWAIRGG